MQAANKKTALARHSTGLEKASACCPFQPENQCKMIICSSNINRGNNRGNKKRQLNKFEDIFRESSNKRRLYFCLKILNLW